MMQTTFDIEALPVFVMYIGETVRDSWKCDQWRGTISSKAGVYSFDYFTGLGHRKARKDAPKCGFPRNTIGAEQWEKQWVKPVQPKIADVLYSLFMDANAADNNFHDWCADYGFSDDSIKALNTYKQCLDTATALRKHFSPDQRQAIQAIISEM
jgi:hypothetical protein